MSEDLAHLVNRTFARLLDAVRQADPPGALADHIPELALADPALFAISATTVSGNSYRAGDSGSLFTIQSVSKPFVYALALAALGPDIVTKHLGVEPSGEAFNAISFDTLGRPANPMVNVGALVATSLIAAHDAEERFATISEGLSAFAGRPLTVDESVYASESATGDRNRGLAALARASGALACGIEEALEPYFRQCSLLVSTVDLSVMAATLANHGTNPLTGVQVVRAGVARHVLSVMVSSGMYDRSGQWMVEVGMPAKSGVGGGIIAVTPGQVGIGVFSPPLDEVGNSSRGVEALRRLSDEFGLHMLNHPDVPPSPIAQVVVAGGRARLELRGELDFVDTEIIVSAGTDVLAAKDVQEIVLDLGGVTTLSPVARLLLREVAGRVHVLDPDGLL